jgi:pimeloyl-ACP methyl ester carboxylesterase
VIPGQPPSAATDLPGAAGSLYAPYGLILDPARLGLERIDVTGSSDGSGGSIGTAVAHYRRTARSPRATIFLHGAAGSWTTWTPLLQAADAAGVPINNPVLLDLPGWGDATLTADADSLTLEAVCAIVKQCAEELGYTEWDIVGHSMGGFIALHMASLWRESVLSVGIVSGTGRSIIRSVEHPLRHFGELPAFTLLWRAMVALAPAGEMASRILAGLRRIGMLRLAVSPLFRHTRRIDTSVINALGAELKPRPFALAATLVRGYNPQSRWGRIHCSVRALNGDRDVFSTADDLAELGAAIDGSVLTVIDDCGHFAAVERPHEVLVALGYELPRQLPHAS